MEFKILDLFCGAGGFSWGMHKNEHFQTCVALDFNEKAANTFKQNMPDTYVFTGDITNEDTKKEIIAKSKEMGVNMIIGGPPCQGFALKGKKLGLKDERNYLFREYLRLVEILRPEVFVIENVKALLSTASGWFRDEILRYIHSLGYKVNYGVLRALEFGVPQSRERAIFICSRSIGVHLPKGDDSHYVTVRDAISDLAYLNSGEGDFEQEYTTEPMSEYQTLMRNGSSKLYNHKASAHSELAIKKLMMIPAEKGKEFLPEELKGKQVFNSTWGRLSWDRYSPTIDTRFDTPSNGTNSHPELHRSITPREAARIQSFDDKFIFYGSKVFIRTQIGNAVPPLMAKAIADEIWKTYNDYENYMRQSDEYENNLSDSFKKEHGIFYTDIELANNVVKFLDIKKDASIIDPCCGTGSFLQMAKNDGHTNLYGCDFDSTTVEKCKSLTGIENIYQCDTLGNSGENILSHLKHSLFDYAIGNPPYAPIDKNVKLESDAKFCSFVKKNGNNLYIAAVLRSFELVKPDGIISYVIPKNILHVDSYAGIREKILKEKTIISVINLGIHFKQVRGEQIVLTIKNSYTPGNKVKFYSYENSNIVYKSEASQDSYTDKIIIFASNEEIHIYNKLRSINPKLKDICPLGIRRGRSSDDNAIRGKQIRKFGFKDIPLSQNGTQVFIQNIFAAEAGITACFGGDMPASETVTVANFESKSLSKYVLGLLSSRLCNYYLIRFIFNDSRLTIHTDAKYLYQIPIITDTLFVNEVLEYVDKLESLEYMSEEWLTTYDKMNRTIYNIYQIKAIDANYIESEMRKISANKWYPQYISLYY